MKLSARRQERLAGKGRILQMRPGINPNSSGYGILWGAIFFLPFSTVVLLVSAVEKSLARALERHKAETAGRRLAPELLPIWLFSWAGFAFVWAYLITSLEPGHSRDGLSASLAVAAFSLPVFLVLLYRCRHRPGLPELSRKAALMALYGTLGVTVLALLSVAGNLGLPFWLTALIAILVYLNLVALLLAAGVLKLSGLLRGSMLKAAVIYVVVGFVSIIPFIPVPADSYNAVGLGFLLWAPGAPLVAALAGLLLLGRDAREDPENPL